MIDKNGKLFGKINIIDLLIILVVIAALVFIAIKVLAPDSSSGEAQTAKVQIGFYAAQVEQGFGENVFYEGAPLYEDLTNVSLGELTDWNVEPEYEYQVNSDGETVKVEHTNNHFVNIGPKRPSAVASPVRQTNKTISEVFNVCNENLIKSGTVSFFNGSGL